MAGETAAATLVGLTAVIAQTFACDEALATLVAAQARLRHWPQRATMIGAGERFDAILLIVAGRARLLAYGIDGRVVMVQDFAVGDLIGEGALIDEGAAGGEIVATESVDAGSIATPVFIGLMSNHACIALAVSRLLVTRLSMATRRIVEGATLSAVGRIHAEVLRAARASEAMTISPLPVLAELARAVQSTRETVSRTISALEKRGIVRRTGDALIVVAPHRLEELIY
ncbi:MAG: Crp/Fnr family transcriptional regulator [Sphingomonadaceae bacterium]